MHKKLTWVAAFLVLVAGLVATGRAEEEGTPIPASITTPDRVESKVGTLEFKDGYPTEETAAKLADELDYLHGVEAFMNSVQGVSLYALRKGLADVGIHDGDFFYTSRMLDSKSLLLTANADTVYFWGNLDLSEGPLVVETPPMVLGIFDDFWFRWVGDFGLAGPDKGARAGPSFSSARATRAPFPRVGTSCARSRTNHVTMLFRAFLEDDDPAPAIARTKETLKVYPYKSGRLREQRGELPERRRASGDDAAHAHDARGSSRGPVSPSTPSRPTTSVTSRC